MNSHKLHPFCTQLKYENTKSKKFKNNIGKRENIIYNKITDTYTCANNKELKFIAATTRKAKGNKKELPQNDFKIILRQLLLYILSCFCYIIFSFFI